MFLQEMHSGFVENNLLSQVRVVWPRQVMPAWVNKNICIFVTVGEAAFSLFRSFELVSFYQ